VTRRFLDRPVVPLEVDPDANVASLLQRMGRISFQGRNLSKAFAVWKEMLQHRNVIFLGLAGAMIPAGMRKLMVFLIEHRFIDCLVVTGANLFHDIHESLGRRHYIGHPGLPDEELREAAVDRIYDTLASEDEFRATDYQLATWATQLDLSRAWTTREYLYEVGRVLSEGGHDRCMVSEAYRAGIPIYCPAIGDSSIGLALLRSEAGKRVPIIFDVVSDVAETGRIVEGSPSSGVIYVGGGTPKNFIQQTEVLLPRDQRTKEGHRYAIQITADAPFWGGLSGCTFDEAKSWGKISSDAAMVTVRADATVALPILVTALSQEAMDLARARPKPGFEMGRELSVHWDEGQ